MNNETQESQKSRRARKLWEVGYLLKSVLRAGEGELERGSNLLYSRVYRRISRYCRLAVWEDGSLDQGSAMRQEGIEIELWTVCHCT